GPTPATPPSRPDLRRTGSGPRSLESSSEFHSNPELRPPVIVLFLQHALGHALVVAQQRVVQVELIHIDAEVSGEFLRRRDVELLVRVVKTVLRVVGADDVDVGAVEIHRHAAAEAALLVRRREVADMARLPRQRTITG